VLSAWESRGTWFAIGVAGSLFALLHGNLYGIPAYLLVGAIAGFMAYALDSVYAAMVYHTVYNTACLVIPYLASNREAADVTIDAAAIFSLAVQTAMIASMMLSKLTVIRAPRLLKRPVNRPNAETATRKMSGRMTPL
jgi:membrane protease YdiL (CAAX protease family)